MTYYEATVRARGLLIEAGILPETATLDADLLARHASGWDLATWLARRGETVTDAFVERYQQLVSRRRVREPVAYIRGVQEFWGRAFQVTNAVLIPRPETELLVEQALEFLADRSTARVVDVGTGSGCIAVTIALERPSAEVYASDISEPALAVARTNAGTLGAHQIRFVHGSLLDGVPMPIDLVVTNPPYVAERDGPALTPEVRDYEPAVALYGGFDGWHHIRGLLESAPAALSKDGRLLMEIGYGQSEALAAEVDRVAGLTLRAIRPDLQGIPRVAVVSLTD